MWKRLPHAPFALALTGALAGCVGTAVAPGDDPRVADFEPTETVCPTDPDAFIGGDPSSYECPDYWVCEEIPGGKRCYTPGADYPDDGEWRCWDEDGVTVCEGNDFPDGGGDGDWDCERRGDLVICRDDTPDYPDEGGDGPWDCFYADEYRVCDSGGGYPGGGGGDGGGDTPGGGGGGDWPPADGGFCFYPTDDPDGPVVVEGGYRFENVGGRDAVHVTLIFNPGFVDNTYGANSSDGYRGGNNGHTFRDLVSSDMAEVGFADASGREVLHAKFDYISPGTTTSGYDSLGAAGGDGAMMSGDLSAVLDATSSLDRNLNELGCVYLTDSPTEAECPGWENRVIYEMWIAADAFGSAGFGYPILTYVHASPSRTTDTIPVTPGPCP